MDRELSAAALRSAIFVCAAAPAAIVDMRRMRIPDAFSLGGLGCLLLVDASRDPARLPEDLAAAALAFCTFLAIRLGTRGLGLGDLKFAAMCACFAGLPRCFLAMGAAAAGALLFYLGTAIRKGKPRGFMIPFAPFIAGGAALAAILGHLFAA